MAYSSPPRNIERLLKNKNAALKLKNGSPKFRDVLRERCKSKVKENRQKFVDLLRSPKGNNDLNRVLHDTIYEELKAFTSTANNPKENPFEITNDKILEEELKLFEESNYDPVEEYFDAEVELIMQSCYALLDETCYIESLLETEGIDVVDCPVCEKGTMILSDSEITCSHCTVNIKAKTSLSSLNEKIKLAVTSHSKACTKKPNFLSSDTSLKLTCQKCFFYFGVIA